MTVRTKSADALARRAILPLHDDLLRLLQELVRTNSVALPPIGNETPAQNVLHDFLVERNIDTELYDTAFVSQSDHRMVRKDRDYRGRKNLIARLPGSGLGKSLLLNGHMDTVPPGETPWRASPWSGSFDNGRVYGLGSFDMKGGSVAQAAVLCALKLEGIRLGGDLLFESVIDEEWGGGGGSLAARLKKGAADACVIAEGTQQQIFRATRGGAVIDLTVEAGDPSSYFSAAEVVNPAAHIGSLLGWVELWRKRRANTVVSGAYADFPDPTPVQILAVEANRLEQDVPLSVPMKAGVRLYFQFLPRENPSEALAEIESSLREFEQNDPFFRTHSVRWAPLYDPPLLGHELAEDHPFVKCLVTGSTAVCGSAPVVTAAPYPCDAFLMQREFGIPTLLFGPTGAFAHNANEYVDFASVIQTAEILLAAALDWCSG